MCLTNYNRPSVTDKFLYSRDQLMQFVFQSGHKIYTYYEGLSDRKSHVIIIIV